MKTRVLALCLSMLALIAVAGPAGARLDEPAAAPEAHITDIAGDANLINGQGQSLVTVPDQSTTPASYGPADIRTARWVTTYVAVPVGDDGIDYQATGFQLRLGMEAIPKSDGPTLIYRVSATLEGCNFFIDSYLRGPASGPTDPVDKSLSWRQLTAAPTCPNGATTQRNTAWTVTVDSATKELVATFPYSSLSYQQLPFMSPGAILSTPVVQVRTLFGLVAATVTAPQVDDTKAGNLFEIGSDVPADVPCTTGCPAA